jgi:hypothetical protein
MDAYTTALLAVVALSIVAITVPTVRLAFRFFTVASLRVGKEENLSPSGEEDIEMCEHNKRT